ncbi:predicted protein [Uncinocarpus reesii 1704]|uniref:SET domain-containing protein n=1 Tax=Uncinocarpus reesii (strain UAMH 1704) TaxID=336963 RepID=C4JIF7_UNCRE|nr:uncharacterized protein UREG_01494 [Uncinocarpus reesii 1704]EEP76645.1 predicted protein [Uncinocarpus reesii 1704]
MKSTNEGTLRAEPRETPDAGTGLFATTEITAGHPILELDTWLTVLDTTRLADTCSSCFGVKTLRDREVDGTPEACQVSNWAAVHKHECKIFKKLHPNILPTNSRVVLRIIIFKTYRQDDPGGNMQRFDALESHQIQTLKSKPEYFQKLALSARAVREYSGTELSLHKIIEYFCKLDINAFTLTTPFYDHVGAAIEPLAALCNHSCSPNAATDFDKGKIWVRALRDIGKGEQVFVSYIETTDPYAHRQSELLKRYYFNCKCNKCEIEKNAPDTHFLRAITAVDSKTIQNAQQEAMELFEMVKPGAPSTDSIKNLRSAMSALRRTTLWPLTRQPYVRLRGELIASLMGARQFQSAFVHCVIRHLRVNPVVYPNRWHPISSMHKWVFVKLMRYLTQAGDLGVAEGVDLSKYDLNLFIIIYSVLLDLEATVSNELPTVENIYRDSLADFANSGWTLEMMQSDIEEQWQKLETLADEALQVDEISV